MHYLTRFILSFSLLGLWLCLLPLGLSAQDLAQQPIPFDPDTRTGTLDNGLRYYVRYNAKPDNYAELRLALNAGSLMETEAQQGLAHFVEHMCFNGTKNFPKSALVDYLESIGTKFGAHLNAYTSFDETVYMLRVPTDEESKFTQGFQILEDWAHNVTMEGEEIDKERGVVIEEWRTRLGAQQRMQEETYPKFFYGSRYAERIPIGDTAVLHNFEHETLRSFYQNWYRPDLMAVVAVGDFDVDAVEQMIKDQFAGLENPERAPARESYSVPDHEETLIALAQDEEAPFNQIQLLYKQEPRNYESLSDYRVRLVTSLANSMLNDRLGELTQQENPPFNYARAGYGGMVRSKDAYNGSAIVANGKYLSGLGALLTEIERAHRYGFTASELERTKNSLLTSRKQRYSERDKYPSKRLVGQYVSHFLEGSPVPGIEAELALAEQILPMISLEEVNQTYQGFINEGSRVVSLTGSQSPDNPLPSEAEVRELLAQVKAADLEPYAEEMAEGPLLSEAPQPGKVVSRAYRDDIEVTELTFDNGLTAVLKPTTFKNNEVNLRAFSPGGSSLYPNEVYPSANMADQIVSSSGLGPFNNVQLEKYLSDKVASVSPYIGEREEGFRGSSSTDELETLLQMVHLYFTAPRKDEQAFNSMMSRNKSLFANLSANPQYWYQGQVVDLLYGGNPRRRFLPTPEELDQVSLDKAYEVFRERFSNAGDFTFILVGNFEVEKMEALLSQYLGSLPGSGDGEEAQDNGVRILTDRTEKSFYKGKEPQAQVTLMFNTPAEWSTQTRYQLNSATDVLGIMLRESMREEKGGVYGVRVGSSASRFPAPYYQVSISFTCSPDNAEDLIQTAMKGIEQLQEEGPSEQNMQKIKETQRKEYQVGIQKNSFWLSNLDFAYSNDLDPARVLKTEQHVEALTAEAVQEAAQRFMQPEHYVRMVLLPDTEKEER